MKKLYVSFVMVSVLAISYNANGQTSDKATLSPAEKVTEEPVKKAAVNSETPTLSESSKKTIVTEPTGTVGTVGTVGTGSAPKLAAKQGRIEPPRP